MKNRILIQLLIVVQVIIYIQIDVFAQDFIQINSDTMRIGSQMILTSPDGGVRSGGIAINMRSDWNGVPYRLVEDEVADIIFTPDGDIVFRTAKSGPTNTPITFIDNLKIKNNGGVTIDSNPNSDYELVVCGTIGAKEIKVRLNWCDFVFDPGYHLLSLEEELQFIQKFGHLSGFLSEAEMAGEINLGDVTKRQQQKLEESYLHLIKLNTLTKTILQDNIELKKEITDLKDGYTDLKRELAELKTLLAKQ